MMRKIVNASLGVLVVANLVLFGLSVTSKPAGAFVACGPQSASCYCMGLPIAPQWCEGSLLPGETNCFHDDDCHGMET